MENRFSKSKSELDFSRPWDFSDVVLVVEGKRFHVHRSILAMWSPVFSRMFSADFREKTAQVLHLPEKKASEIKEMLLVIYPTSAKQIDENSYHFLLNLAEEYMMKMLFEKCEEFLINCLNQPRQSSVLCLGLLDIAQEYRLEKLQMVCIDKARNISFWKLKDDPMYTKINFSNFQQIVEGMIKQLELAIQQLERELDAMKGKVRKLQNKITEVESHASSALTEFETIASILVQVVRDASKDRYQGYINTESLDDKLRLISKGDGSFSHLRIPLNNLRSKLQEMIDTTVHFKTVSLF